MFSELSQTSYPKATLKRWKLSLVMRFFFFFFFLWHYNYITLSLRIWKKAGFIIGEGNGNPLQCSCLENARDGGAWWAAVYGAAQSQTRLKWLRSSSSKALKHPLNVFFFFFICLFLQIWYLGKKIDTLKTPVYTQIPVPLRTPSLMGGGPWLIRKSHKCHLVCYIGGI